MSICFRIPCSECDGRGAYCLVSSIDPSAKLYECDECQGLGYLDQVPEHEEDEAA